MAEFQGQSGRECDPKEGFRDESASIMHSADFVRTVEPSRLDSDLSLTEVGPEPEDAAPALVQVRS